MGNKPFTFLLLVILAAWLAASARAAEPIMQLGPIKMRSKTARSKTTRAPPQFDTPAPRGETLNSDHDLLARATAAPLGGDIATTQSTNLELLQSGDAYMKSGDFARAEECFKTAFKREQANPTLDRAASRRLTVRVGLAYQNNKEIARAQQLYKKALATDPRYPLYHYYLAVAYAFEDADRAASEGEPPPAAQGAAPGQAKPRAAPDTIFEELRRAYQDSAGLNPGEKIPNPRTDFFLSPLRHDSRFLAVIDAAGPAAEPDILADLDEMVKAGEDAGPEMRQAIVEEIEAAPARAAEPLLRKLADTALSDRQRAAVIWALGRTADPAVAEPLAHILYQPEMIPVKGAALEALSHVGGPQAGQALLLELRDARDENERFMILTLLANMQFDPALPLMLGLLRQDSEQAANQMAFCFGKMGSKAVPTLLGAIGDADKTTRINAANMLLWLNSSRAMIPLQKRYIAEPDPEVRLALMGAVASLMRPDQFEVFLKAALARETDRDVKSTMREKLAQLPVRKEVFEKFKAAKVDDRNRYMAAFAALYKTFGRTGSMDDLARASTSRDEPDLEKLRARVLERQSEESFADYMKINRIIANNRMLGK